TGGTHGSTDGSKVQLRQIHGGWVCTQDRVLVNLRPVGGVIDDHHGTVRCGFDEGGKIGQCHLSAAVTRYTDGKFLRAANGCTNSRAKAQANRLERRANANKCGGFGYLDTLSNP